MATSELGDMRVFVPKGEILQKKVDLEEIVETLSHMPLQEFQVNYVVLGLVFCTRPVGKAGLRAPAIEPQDVSKCDFLCRWHVELPENQEKIENDFSGLLEALQDQNLGTLGFAYYASLARRLLERHAHLRTEFSEHPGFAKIEQTGQSK